MGAVGVALAAAIMEDMSKQWGSGVSVVDVVKGSKKRGSPTKSYPRVRT
jgi:hypothetical protein